MTVFLGVCAMADWTFPLTKNRYFPHKHLRSADFEREQTYLEDKTAAMNHWALGSGVLTGLQVNALGKEALSVESGLGVDRQGRFLAVPQSRVVPLSALPGLEALSGETAFLWLVYEENCFDPVPVSGQDRRQDGAVREETSFLLTDTHVPFWDPVEGQLVAHHLLAEHPTVQVYQMLPWVLPRQGTVELRLLLRSFEPDAVLLQLHYAPKLTGYVDSSTGKPLEVDQTLWMQPGETMLSFSLSPHPHNQQAGSFSLLPEQLRLAWKHHILQPSAPRTEQFLCSDSPRRELKTRLERCALHNQKEDGPMGIPLAGLRLERAGLSVELRGSFPLLANRACSGWVEARLEDCMEYFGPLQPAHPQPDPEPENPQWCSGVLDLPLHPGNRDVIFYTDETPHGLGLGQVYMDFGLENTIPAVNLREHETDVLLGEPSLFAQASGTYDCPIERGIRLHPQRGTFELAVRPRGELRQEVLHLRWHAWRAGPEQPPLQATGTLLRLEPDLIRVKPGERVLFVPVFTGGGGGPCTFYVTSPRDGQVDRDGAYTAPQQPGVCQVWAKTCTGMVQQACAFVLVEDGGQT